MTRRITRRALGRSGQLGDLYNARVDDFLTENIFGNALPKSVVRAEDCRDVTFKFDRLNNYSSTFSNLEIEAELKLNILSGILKVEGHGRYMSNISKSANSYKITLSLLVNRKREVLQISYEELAKYICDKAFLNSSATHVVTEVLWGANIFAIFEQQKSNRDERETIEGELAVELQKAGPLLSGGVQADLEASGGTIFNVNNLHIAFSGDLEMTGVPTTIPEALKMIKTIPDSISKTNGGKGVQIQFTLSPIQDVLQYVGSALQSQFEKVIIREANKGLVKLIEFTFDESLILQQKIQQVIALGANYRDIYLHKDEVRQMNLKKIEMDIVVDVFRRNLASLLNGLRTSVTVNDEEEFATKITHLVKEYYNDESNRTEQFLHDYKGLHKKCEVIERLTSMNVECIPLMDEFHESIDEDVYILITSSHLLKSEASQFERKCNEFIDLIKKTKNTRFVFLDTNDHQFSATKIEYRPKTTSLTAHSSKSSTL